MARSSQIKMMTISTIQTNPYNFPFPSLQTVARQFKDKNRRELGRVIMVPSGKDEYILSWDDGFVRGELKREFEKHPWRIPSGESHVLHRYKGKRDSCTYSIRIFTEGEEDVSSRLRARVNFHCPYLETARVRDPRAPGMPGRLVDRYGKPIETIERLDSNRGYWFLAPVKIK